MLLVDVAAPDDPELLRALAELKLEALPQRGAYFTDLSRDLGMAEVLLPPDSELVSQNVLKAGFHSKYRLHVVGLRRGRKTVATGFSEEKLRPGDTLLVIGRWKHIRELQKQKRDFLVLSLPAEIDQAAPARSRAPYALGILAIMVTLMVTGWVPNALAALIACLLLGHALHHARSAYKIIQYEPHPHRGHDAFFHRTKKTGGVDSPRRNCSTSSARPNRACCHSALRRHRAHSLFVPNTATAVLMPIALTVAHCSAPRRIVCDDCRARRAAAF